MPGIHRTRQSWGRAVLAAFAVFALLTRLAAPAAAHRAPSVDELLSDPHALCLDAGEAARDGAPSSPLHAHDACGECCLSSVRLDSSPAPAASEPAPRPAPVAIVWRVHDRAGRGPPAEAWSPHRAQRAPPIV